MPVSFSFQTHLDNQWWLNPPLCHLPLHSVPPSLGTVTKPCGSQERSKFPLFQSHKPSQPSPDNFQTILRQFTGCRTQTPAGPLLSWGSTDLPQPQTQPCLGLSPPWFLALLFRIVQGMQSLAWTDSSSVGISPKPSCPLCHPKATCAPLSLLVPCPCPGCAQWKGLSCSRRV